MSISKLTFTTLNCAAALAALVVTSSGKADAGDFTLDWGTYDWPGGNLGPLTRTLRDQYGFEVDLTFEHTGSYTGFSGEGTPNDSTIGRAAKPRAYRGCADNVLHLLQFGRGRLSDQQSADRHFGY